MSTLTSHYQFILPAVNNPVDANIWGGQLNTDWTNNDTYIYAINKGNIGTSQPTIPATAAPSGGMTWIDSTANPWVIKIYDGTQWVMTGSINTTDHVYSNVGNIAVNVQTFTTAGSYTYTPSVGMSYCIVELVGGGGGGGGYSIVNPGALAGSAGGGGQYTRQIFTLAQIGASQPIVIGAGGVGGVLSTTPTAGATSTFGAGGILLSVAGGGAGANSSGTPSTLQGIAGGAGGTSNGNLGFLAVPGTQGGNGMAQNSGFIFAFGGAGGNSFFGGGGAGGTLAGSGTNVNGGTSVSPGAGGGGAASILVGGGASGGAGRAGAVIITEFI